MGGGPGEDELGRLAAAFNAMCGSIQNARQNLIRQERIATIGRMSTSIVHDLRNPLAAIYGGAEMLVDGGLSPAQVQRLSGNIYRSSRRMQQMLQEATFDFSDFVHQMRLIKRMGSLGGLMKMIPGMNKIDDGMLKRFVVYRRPNPLPEATAHSGSSHREWLLVVAF